METKEEETSALTKKTSVKRRESDKRRSLPVSSATSSSPSPPSSSSPLPSKPPRAPPTGNMPKKSMSVSVSRTSSIRSTASAPTSSSMSTSTTTMKQTTNQASNMKSDRRSSAPPVGGSTNGHGRPAEPSGGTGLMSIVEDVAKADREGWGKIEKEKENIGAGSGLGVGLRVREEEEEGANTLSSNRKQPTSIALEDVRVPRGIDLEDLKEQMERERAEKLEKRGHVLSQYTEQAPSTGRPRSGSASAAISRRPTRGVRDTSHLDLGPTTPALAPLADIPVVKETPRMNTCGISLDRRCYLYKSQLQPPPQSQQTSPKGSQMGSSASTAIPTITSKRDVKGKGQETIDGFTDSGAIAIIGSTGADSIPSPPPSNLSTGTSSPPRLILYSLPTRVLLPLLSTLLHPFHLFLPTLHHGLSI
ncbi:hypothetical protein F5877DRAFT_82612 [Lentinula edodes]|nr:hypothetical protein F5877DRAFT_82612 [Lentinula edodes]